MDNQSILFKFLTACKVPANWAKIITGAIIGALTAAGILSQNSCTLAASSDQGSLSISITPAVLDSGKK